MRIQKSLRFAGWAILGLLISGSLIAEQAEEGDASITLELPSPSDSIEAPPEGTLGLYNVVPGDTLYSIAKKHHTTVRRLRVLNQMSSGPPKIGQALIVPVRGKQALAGPVIVGTIALPSGASRGSTAPPVPEEDHVRRGRQDTLGEIVVRSFAVCVLWWPLAFSAIKFALNLRFRWTPFVLGYFLAALASASLSIVLIVNDGAFDIDPSLSSILIESIAVPVATGVLIALCIPLFFASTRTRAPSMSWLLRARERMQRHPSTFIAYMTTILVALSILFPPWVAPLGAEGLVRRLGYGNFFSPPEGSPMDGLYAHIDYSRLGLQIVVIVLIGTLTWTIAQRRTRGTDQ